MPTSQTTSVTFTDVLVSNGLTPDIFFRDYWQKKPLYLKGLAPDWHANIDAETLAGLSLEDSLDSRMIIGNAAGEKSVKHGPLAEDDFAERDRSQEPWTVLVHGVDRALPSVAATLDFWSGFPAWRMDDVMISYATDGGGVGPHFDEYDVFLIQIQGERRWVLGDFCSADTPLLQREELKLIANMGENIQHHQVRPGDALYVPAHMAHNGIACGECITWSMGFRSPTWGETLLSLTEHLLEDDSFAANRYQDTHATLMAPEQLHAPAAITLQTVDRFKTTLCEWIQQSNAFEPWLCSFLSEHKQHRNEPKSLDDNIRDIARRLGQAVESKQLIMRDEDTEILYMETSDFCLYVNGAKVECPPHSVQVAKLLANQRWLHLSELYQLSSSKETIMWLADLVKKGVFYLE